MNEIATYFQVGGRELAIPSFILVFLIWVLLNTPKIVLDAIEVVMELNLGFSTCLASYHKTQPILGNHSRVQTPADQNEEPSDEDKVKSIVGLENGYVNG